jgi:hypothetical protein
MEPKTDQGKYHYYIGCFSEGKKDAEEIIRGIPPTLQNWEAIGESDGKFLILHSVKTGAIIYDLDLRADAIVIASELGEVGGKAFYVSRQLHPLASSRWDGLAASFLSRMFTC